MAKLTRNVNYANYRWEEYVLTEEELAQWKTGDEDIQQEIIENADWDEMANIILEAIAVLKSAGANFIVIPSNTPHYGFDKIKKASPLPILNLIEITADECESKGYKKVAVLGTKPTMQKGLYNEKLRTRGIEPVIPNEALCDEIHELIISDIIPGQTNESLREKVKAGIKSIDCDAVILGCTELPEVYNSKNLNKPAVDTARLLAHKAIDVALSVGLNGDE